MTTIKKQTEVNMYKKRNHMSIHMNDEHGAWTIKFDEKPKKEALRLLKSGVYDCKHLGAGRIAWIIYDESTVKKVARLYDWEPWDVPVPSVTLDYEPRAYERVGGGRRWIRAEEWKHGGPLTDRNGRILPKKWSTVTI